MQNDLKEKQSVSAEELSLLVDAQIQQSDFLSACDQDDPDLKSFLVNRFRKYKVTESEYSMSYAEISNVFKDAIRDLFSKTVLDLSNSGLIDMGVNEEGNIGLSPTEFGKKVAKEMRKK
jgi:hypothetical protein